MRLLNSKLEELFQNLVKLLRILKNILTDKGINRWLVAHFNSHIHKNNWNKNIIKNNNVIIRI
jgi:hypothetical protein